MRQLQERYKEKKKMLYHVFVDLEKAFDRVPREVVAWSFDKADGSWEIEQIGDGIVWKLDT